MKNFRKEYAGRSIVTICGLFLIALTVIIAVFLIIRGSGTFTQYHHSIAEFLFSSEWAPNDAVGEGGGKVGAAVYIVGSLLTCGLAIAIAAPLALAEAIFITEISPKLGSQSFSAGDRNLHRNPFCCIRLDRSVAAGSLRQGRFSCSEGRLFCPGSRHHSGTDDLSDHHDRSGRCHQKCT